jgi:hypothetical protein
MRSYPIDSPEAAVRILAMTLVADSGPGSAEFNVLKPHDAAGMGLTSHRLHTALREFLRRPRDRVREQLEPCVSPRRVVRDGGDPR